MAKFASVAQDDERSKREERRTSSGRGGAPLHESSNARSTVIEGQRLHRQIGDLRGDPEDTSRGRHISATANLPTHRDSPTRRGTTPSAGRCQLLELPAELREQIWMHVVTEWTAIPDEDLRLTAARSVRLLQKRAIRMDRFNRPSPPALALVSHQLRAETLHLYYELNVFECWRPLFWLKDWTQSTFIDWLVSLGRVQTKWLRDIVLLYKHESELEHDVDEALTDHGFELMPGLISNKQELSEYEMCFEELGLPRHFGKRRRFDRWLAATSY
ncbi:hypothetical protein DOTSEDRAFT_81280 [Dothistroma septosporum NZE10]|uniref:F-box domain-containing protein n=1 Tax=Dothistroma septosporum (strain NZE10 / CBS 128990) TaxID=675120 RepID=N1PLE9_DOTSN|nr:hypothetical protein DOTSEDRAFT_81280 [Dothistroma septosporum NZE10]